jgi:hypothetical protein
MQAACVANAGVKAIEAQNPRTPVSEQNAIGFCIIAYAVGAIER